MGGSRTELKLKQSERDNLICIKTITPRVEVKFKQLKASVVFVKGKREQGRQSFFAASLL